MPFPPLVSLRERERRAEVEGDGGGRETQKEKTREDGAQQRSVLVCANQHTHTQWMCLASHTQREDKTRHGNGDTHMGMDETTGHDTQGGGKGKGEDKGWLKPRHSPLHKRKRKRQKDNDQAQRQ